MTRDEVRAKWATAKRMIKVTRTEWDSQEPEANAIKIIKTKLRIAIDYLSQLDEHGNSYTMPFTGNQMKWALEVPATQDKIERVTDWCHQSYQLREKAYPSWKYEEETA